MSSTLNSTMSSNISSGVQTFSSTISDMSTDSSSSVRSTTLISSTTTSHATRSTSPSSSLNTTTRSTATGTFAPAPTSGALEPSSSTSSVTPLYTPVDPTPPQSHFYAFKLVIDLGECAGLGLPKVLEMVDTTQVDLKLESLGDNRYTTVLRPNEVGGAAVIYLEDDGERCGTKGACVNVQTFFQPDPGRMLVQVMRGGDLGLTMYPFSLWMDDGRLFNDTPVDSQANKYNCWGWSDEDCPFAYTDVGDPMYALSSSTLNATTYITFCPTDGPSLSSVKPNPKPYDPETTVIATGIVLGTESVVPISTVLSPLSTTSRHLPGHMTPLGSRPTSITSGTPPSTVTTAPDGTDDWDLDNDSTSTGTCVKVRGLRCGFTQVVVSKTTIVPLRDPILTPLPAISNTTIDVFSTFVHLATTAVVPVSTLVSVPIPTRINIKASSLTSLLPTSTGEGSNLPGPSSPFTVVPIPTTLVDSQGAPIATSTISAVIVPTFSAVADNRGSAVSTVSFNLTTTAPPPSPTPPPESLVTLTSWTTYMTVNGSTVPAIGAQVGVLTTVSETYILDSGTVIPLDAYSSISAKSVQTSLPSDTPLASADTASNRKASTVAAAIVGSLVGATLLGVILWVFWVKCRRRQYRAPDYARHQSPVWGSGSVHESGSRESGLDLDSEPQPRESFVEPWVQRREPAVMSRKMQREMEERGEGLVTAGPSHNGTATNSSDSQAHNTTRPSKSPNQASPQLPDTSTRSPAHSNSPLLAQSSQEPRHPSPPLAPVQIPVQPSPSQSQLSPPQLPSVYSRYHSEEVRDTTIPPQYNEAWNVRRPPSGE